MAAEVIQLRSYTRALASRTRLHILALLSERSELGAAEISMLAGLSRPLASWHLRRLRRAGLVRQRRQGREVRYSLDAARLLARQSELTDHVEKLVASANGAESTANSATTAAPHERKVR